MPLRTWALACLTVLSLSVLSEAVKKEDFKTCSQSSFCRRNRALADTATADAHWVSPYTLVKDSIRFSNNFMTADVQNTQTNNVLVLELQVLVDNTVRVRMDEKSPILPRYKDHEQFTLVDKAKPIKPLQSGKNTEGIVKIALDSERKIVVTPSPLVIEFFVKDEPVITLNERGFFNFEHLRTKESHKPKMIKQKKEDGTEEEVEAPEEKDLWEETFKSWTDSKPRGPESIGMDISFNGFSHVYGIPVSRNIQPLYINVLCNRTRPCSNSNVIYRQEHASTFSLKETRGGEGAYDEPYRLYNTDVFEYEMDSPSALYGSVPFMMAHRKNESVGVFWMNPSETWIDIVKTTEQAEGVSFTCEITKMCNIISFGDGKSNVFHRLPSRRYLTLSKPLPTRRAQRLIGSQKLVFLTFSCSLALVAKISSVNIPA